MIISYNDLKDRIKNQCLITGEFKLRSGQISNYYFDKYLFESDYNLLYQTSYQLSNLIKAQNLNIQMIAGLELGGIPIATCISQQLSLPLLMVRKKAKEYGTKKIVEGMDFAGKNICVIEDVVTTGGQVLESCNILRGSSSIVLVACAILRDNKGKENLKNLNFIHLFDFRQEKNDKNNS